MILKLQSSEFPIATFQFFQTVKRIKNFTTNLNPPKYIKNLNQNL